MNELYMRKLSLSLSVTHILVCCLNLPRFISLFTSRLHSHPTLRRLYRNVYTENLQSYRYISYSRSNSTYTLVRLNLSFARGNFVCSSSLAVEMWSEEKFFFFSFFYFSIYSLEGQKQNSGIHHVSQSSNERDRKREIERQRCAIISLSTRGVSLAARFWREKGIAATPPICPVAFG